jgi:hypothetical protein
MSPARRLQVAFDLHDFGYARVEAAIAREAPALSASELRLEVLRRFVGEPAAVLRRGVERS